MPGCNCNQNNNVNAGNGDMSAVAHDMVMMHTTGDGAPTDKDGMNACHGDFDPSCTVVSAGPTGTPSMPFPLPTDDPPPANVKADGVGRDPMGDIILDSSHANFDYLWVADDTDYNVEVHFQDQHFQAAHRSRRRGQRPLQRSGALRQRDLLLRQHAGQLARSRHHHAGHELAASACTTAPRVAATTRRRAARTPGAAGRQIHPSRTAV